MKNAIYTLLIMLLAVVNLQAQNNHVVKVPTPDEEVVVGAIGGTVDVSALGGATYTIPIQVPEGLGGVQPNLSITYNSQGGNGLLGWGWNLGGMSAITRVGRTLYHDGEVCGVGLSYKDRYALDGQRLMLIEGEYGGYGAEYKTEVDGMSRIVSHTEDRYADGPAYFTVYTPEGLTMYYGWDRSGDDNARIIWEKDGKKVVVLWLLKRVEDQNGNYMVYNYDVGRNHGINQHVYHLKNIQYCGNPAAQNVPDNERGTKYGIDFNYKIRNDVERNFVGNYELHYQDLLDNISIYYWNEPLYDYTFQYDGSCGQINSDYFYNRLNTIKYATRDGNGYKETTIKWGEKVKEYYRTNLGDEYAFMQGYMKFSGDFNGDGLGDFISVSTLKSKGELLAENGEINNVDTLTDLDERSYREVRVYLNKGHNKTNSSRGECIFQLADSFTTNCLVWIYVGDFDGDGIDEFVQYMTACNWWPLINARFAVRKLMQNDNGNPYLGYISFFDSETNETYPYYNSEGFWSSKRAFIFTGDFLGKGQSDMILQLPKIYGQPKNFRYFNYDKGISKITWKDGNDRWDDERFLTADFDGDGRTEIWAAGDYSGSISKVNNSNGQYEKSHVCYFLDKYTENFIGDFNGDGHADVLSYRTEDAPELANTWRLFLFKQTGHYYPAYSFTNELNNTHGLGYPGRYQQTLDGRETDLKYFLEVADMDGDGKTDLFARTADSIIVFYAPVFEKVEEKSEIETGQFSNKLKFAASTLGLAQAENFSICLGNFLGQENASVLCGSEMTSLPQHSTYYNVASITDGMGNRTSFEYDYLVHNPYPERSNIYDLNRIGENLGFDIYNKPLPIRAVKAIETTNINVANFPISRTEYQYSNAMVHKFGHGFLGFEGITQTNSIGSRKISKTIRTFTFKPMDEHCTLTPESDCVYRFKEGETNPVLISDTYYQHAKFVCELDKLGKVFVPASIKTTTKNYELLGDRQMLRCRINEVRYNDLLGSGPFTYTQLVHPTETWQGTDATEQDDVQRCEFLTHTRTHYMGIAEPWVINRPKQVDTKSTRRTAGFAESKSLTLYTYMTDRPYLVKTVTNYPSGSELDDDLLATRTTFAYRTDGLVERDTVSAFQDHELDGRERVTSYDYTRSLRFVSEEDKQDGFVTHYGYDEVWGEQQWTDDCNGFRTFTDNPDHLGLTTYTYDADNTENHNRIRGTESATALRWIGCDNYKTEYANDLGDAYYFSWAKSETSAETLTIYDAAGRELRTVTHGLTEDDIIFKDTQYDEWGRVLKVSEPYFKDDFQRWISYSYDDFDRVNRTDYPSFESEENGTNVTYYPSTEVDYEDLTTTTKTGVRQSLNGNLVKSHTTSTTLNFMGWTDCNTEYLDEDLQTYNTTSYGYNADGSLAWTKVNGQDFTKVSMGYDNAGNRTTLVDPDYGTTTSVYDAFGQLTYQQTPKHDYTEYEYDRHGRQTTRTETTHSSGTSETTTWTYKETPGQLGLLENITLDDRQAITYSYGNYNRLDNVVESVNRDSYTTTYNYGDASFPLRATGLIYPTGFEISKEYESSTGKLRSIKHDNKNLWYTDEANALGQITSFTYGDGAQSIYEYDERHLLKNQTAENIQNFAYAYDIFANLAARTDNLHGMTESFEYDYLNRLEKITLNGTESIMGYDEYGRIRSKQAQGQDVFSNAIYDDWKKPHAIREATVEGNSTLVPHTIEYTMFDKVKCIQPSHGSVSFDYGHDHQRKYMTVNYGGNTVTKTYVGNCEFNDGNLFGSAKSLTYLSGPMGVFAVVVKDANGERLHYIHKDHLGSWTTITDDGGDSEQVLSFDAWGNLRNPLDWSGIYNGPLLFDRGFTGHEHLWDFSLINMNGRMYDPIMSSFLSVDNYVQSPGNSQNFNRYAYCLNNPLKYTDPSGEAFGIDDAIIIAGVAIGSYVGGSIANETYNPMDWKWGSRTTWSYMFAGGIVGGLSSWAGTAVTASGIPFANTFGIATSSFLNSLGTYAYSGKQTDLTIGLGIASYNITKKEWGYLGKEGNSILENVGYGLGALANVQDLFAGLNGIDIKVKSRRDLFGHSELGEYSDNGAYQNGDALVSVGPNQYCNLETRQRYLNMIEGVDVNTNLGFEMPFVKATLQGRSFPGINHPMIQTSDPQFVTGLHNVSGKIMRKMTTNLNNGRNLLNLGPLKYGLFYGCVNHTSRALAYSGVLNVNALLPITSPVLLNFELAIRNFGIGISPFLYQP